MDTDSAPATVVSRTMSSGGSFHYRRSVAPGRCFRIRSDLAPPRRRAVGVELRSSPLHRQSSLLSGCAVLPAGLPARRRPRPLRAEHLRGQPGSVPHLLGRRKPCSLRSAPGGFATRGNLRDPGRHLWPARHVAMPRMDRTARAGPPSRLFRRSLQPCLRRPPASPIELAPTFAGRLTISDSANPTSVMGGSARLVFGRYLVATNPGVSEEAVASSPGVREEAELEPIWRIRSPGVRRSRKNNTPSKSKAAPWVDILQEGHVRESPETG